MIIKRKNKTLIKGDFGTLLVEACTLMIELRRSFQKVLPGAEVEKAMTFIALASQSKDYDEHIENVKEFCGRKEGAAE